MKFPILLLSVLFSSLSVPASAEENASRGYIGLGPITTSLTSSCASGYWGGCPDPAQGSQSSTYQIIGGYDFDSHFGFEVGYLRLGTYRVANSTNTFLGSFGATAATVTLRAGKTYSNGFAIHGKFGLTQVRTHYTPQPAWKLAGGTNQSSSGFTGGVNAEYFINKTVGFRVSLELLKHSDSEFSNIYGIVGLSTIFNF